MKTTDEIIRHLGIRKNVYRKFIKEYQTKLADEIKTGLELTSFAIEIISNIEAKRSSIEVIDDTLEWIKEK